jgi:hypothetical protein
LQNKQINLWPLLEEAQKRETKPTVLFRPSRLPETQTERICLTFRYYMKKTTLFFFTVAAISQNAEHIRVLFYFSPRQRHAANRRQTAERLPVIVTSHRDSTLTNCV